MRAITVKNIPDNLYQRLKQSATENRRSINSEILVCIDEPCKVRSTRASMTSLPGLANCVKKPVDMC